MSENTSVLMGLTVSPVPGTLPSVNDTSTVSLATGHTQTWPTEVGNVTNTSTTASPGFSSPYKTWQAVLITLACCFIILGTILGNILVCTAVCIVKKLRTPSNLLIVSLAVSDLLVAVLVMPFAVSYEVIGYWGLGRKICDAWTSMDVMLCTASILNLCMISVDRYFVITRPFDYAMKRTPKRMALMIAAVWITSGLISIPPVFGWKDPYIYGHCIVSQDKGYQFYATFAAFYIPLTVMIVIYYRIFMVSARIARAEAKSKPIGDIHPSDYISGSTTPIRKDSHISTSDRIGDEENHNFPNGAVRKTRDDSTQSMIPRRGRFKFLKKNRISTSMESKATKTLGIIMGAFTLCWLPFFILALIRPFKEEDFIPGWLSSLFLWLGYANSFLNPIIYARFNRDFRTPFKEIILFRCRGINRRLRSESYVEQYGSRKNDHTLRDCIKPPVDTVVRYHSHGHTIVNKLGNGDSAPQPEPASAPAQI